MSKILRKYQEEVVQELADCFVAKRGARHYLHMATGSGKTFTVMEFLVRHYLSKGKRVFWLTHRWVLIEQAINELISQHPKFGPRAVNEREEYNLLSFFGSESNQNTSRLLKKAFLLRRMCQNSESTSCADNSSPRSNCSATYL